MKGMWVIIKIHNKKNTVTKKVQRQNKIPKYKYLIATIFMSIIAILPLVVRLKTLMLDKDLLMYHPSQGGYITDIALYYKNIFFIVLVTLLTLVFIGERIYPDTVVKTAYSKYNTNKNYLILCGVFLLTIIISFVFSKSRAVSLLGAPNSFEGTITWIGYILLFIFSINYFDEEFYRVFLYKAFTVLIIFISIFGIVEFFYKSPLDMSIFQYIILPKEYWDQIGTLEITSYFGQISLTLFNPNYAGQFLALGIPILLSIGFTRLEKKWYKTFYLILVGVAAFVLILTGVSAAIYACLIGCIFMVFVHHNRKFSRRMVLSFLVTIVLVLVTSPIKETKLVDAMLADFSNENRPTTYNFQIKEINLEDDGVEFTGLGRQFKVKYDEENNEYIFYDSLKRPIDYIRNNNTYIFTDSANVEIRLDQYDNYFLVDLGYKGPMHFGYVDGQYYAIGVNGSLIDEINNDYTDLNRSLFNFATGRGYIWNLSLPLLKETIIKGFGADSLVFHIPQDDFVGKLTYHGTPVMIIDKPHSMFLQIALSFGIVGLISFLLILMFYFKSSYLIYKNKENVKAYNRDLYIVFIGITTGIICYLICGGFYDSSITLAPLFWIVLGMGVSINNKLMLKDSSN